MKNNIKQQDTLENKSVLKGNIFLKLRLILLIVDLLIAENSICKEEHYNCDNEAEGNSYRYACCSIGKGEILNCHLSDDKAAECERMELCKIKTCEYQVNKVHTDVDEYRCDTRAAGAKTYAHIDGDDEH